LADIPGLIEGAHQGKGLGHEFLKHIQRTKLLLYLLDCSSDDIEGDYKALLEEIELFDPLLAGRPRVVALNKIDLREKAEETEINGGEIPVCRISALTGEGLKELLGVLKSKLKEISESS
jgi:GTP-binding protein